MKFPENSQPVIDAFPGITKERKAELCSHIAQTPDDKGPTVLRQIVANGGEEGALIAKVFDIPVPAKTDAPANKSITPPSKK